MNTSTQQSWWLSGRQHDAPAPRKRHGICRPYGKAIVDDDGLFHPLGITFFWAYQGWKWDRDRVKANLHWCASRGADYVRILGQVNWQNWNIDPGWPDYEHMLGEIVDYIYDVEGMRVEISVIGDPYPAPVDLAHKVARVVRPRQQKILHLEMANEYYNKVDIPTMQQMIRAFQDEGVQNMLALSAPGDNNAVIHAAQQSHAQLFTAHTDRGEREYKWNQIEQGYGFKDLPFVNSSNEPPGPASSVGQNDSPLQLAMMRLVSTMCQASCYVFHVGSMVYGQNRPWENRYANIWEVPNIEAMMKAIRGIDQFLAPDVENWTVANTQWGPPLPVAPFQPDPRYYWSDGSMEDHGIFKAYAALGPGGKVIQLPMGLYRFAELSASYPLRNVTFYNPLTLAPASPSLTNLTLAQGEIVKLPGADDTMSAYVMLGTRA